MPIPDAGKIESAVKNEKPSSEFASLDLARYEAVTVDCDKVNPSKGSSEVVSAIRKTFALLAAPSEIQLASATSTEPNRLLPLGLAINVWLNKFVLLGSFLFAIATTLIALSTENTNERSFGIFLLAFGSFTIVSGVQRAFTTNKLLKSGLIGVAMVTHCKEVTSGTTYELNGFRWKSKAKIKEIPLAD